MRCPKCVPVRPKPRGKLRTDADWRALAALVEKHVGGPVTAMIPVSGKAKPKRKPNPSGKKLAD